MRKPLMRSPDQDQVGQDHVSVPHVPLQGHGQALETTEIWVVENIGHA